MSFDRILAGPTRALWPLLAATLVAAVLGSCWGTSNPGKILDPANGGTEPPPPPPLPPRPPAPTAAPGPGTLLLPGAPTLDATAPVAGASNVNVHAPIALWFSESLRSATASSSQVILRPKNTPGVSLAYQRHWVVGDRLLILAPTQPLFADTDYEVVVSENVTDLDGDYFAPPTDDVVLRFHTVGQSIGVAPEVLGTFPPQGSIHQPNDREAVAVFSKPINFTGITAAVTLTNLTTGLDGAYDRVAGSTNRLASDRVFVFPHLDDALDLAATIQFDIADTLTDVEFVPQSLQAPWTATWDSLAFGRPASVTPLDLNPTDPFPPAVNLNNALAFPVDVVGGTGVLATDEVLLRVHDVSVPTGLEATSTFGAGTASLLLNLTNPGSGNSTFLPTTQLVMAGFAQRGERRSTVRTVEDAEGNEETVLHDNVPPVLFTYGPPSGQFGSQFVTDLPELRPYGTASERIAQIEVATPPGAAGVIRDVYEPSANLVWVGGASTLGTISEGPVDFSVLLTDRAGNLSLIPSPGTASFRGFSSTETLAAASGTLRVVGFDRDSLDALPGAEVYIQDAGGGNEDYSGTGSDGSATFSGRVGPQTVTIIAPGYHTVTLHGSDRAVQSLPLESILQAYVNAPVAVDGVATGILRTSGSTMFTTEGGPSPEASTDIDLDSGLFNDGLNIRLMRPGWFAGFHNVATFPSATYLRLLGVDPRILREPASGSAIPPIEIPIRESMNQVAGSSDHVYALNVTAGATFTTPIDETRVLMTTAIPGLHGQVAIGAGAMTNSASLPNAGVELELGLHGDAVTEGASLTTVFVHLYTRDADQEIAVARTPVTVAAGPPATAIVVPDQPEALAAWTGASYPYTRSFTDTLVGLDGMYRIVVGDSAPQSFEWQIWVQADAAAGGSFTLPTLATTAGGAVGTPPLSTSPGVDWTAVVEAFTMPTGWGANGYFFAELHRDFRGWARAAVSPALSF